MNRANERKLPPNCPKCGYVIEDGSLECPVCGIVIARYLERCPEAEDRGRPSESPPPDAWLGDQSSLSGAGEYASGGMLFGSVLLTRLFTPVEKNCSPFITAGHAAVLTVLLLLSFSLWAAPIESNKAGESFLHLVNLPFHEAGHIFSRPLGEFITSLGGTLGQFLVPLICLGYFLFYRFDNFAAAVCLWWTGENFLDIAPYVNDARAGVLPLIGGNTGQSAPYGFHDWEYLLTETGLLGYDHDIARASQFIGTIIMAAALLWALVLVWRQFQMLRKASTES